ncbi:MAG: helix-turn-helix transcriptional regulator [Bacteroidota bacterium]
MSAFFNVKIQSHSVSWLFVVLEITLMGYQLFRYYTTGGQRKNWFPLLVLLLLLVWNCTLGSIVGLVRLVTINLLVLLLAVALMYLAFLHKDKGSALEVLPDELPEIPDIPETPQEPTDQFLENCHKHALTARETEVVLLLSRGMTYKEIAEMLHISTSTVDSHAQNSYKKAGVNNKIALLHKFLNLPEQ